MVEERQPFEEQGRIEERVVEEFEELFCKLYPSSRIQRCHYARSRTTSSTISSRDVFD